MVKRFKKYLMGITSLCLILGMTGCGIPASTQSATQTSPQAAPQVTTQEIIDDAMSVTSGKDITFYAIMIKGEYFEIYQEGDWGRTQELFLDQGGMYPPMEEGQVVKIVGNVQIYNGGESGYSNEKFIQKIKSYEVIGYRDLLEVIDIADASNNTFNGEHPILKFQDMNDTYFLFPYDDDAVVYKDGELFMEYNNANYMDQEYPQQFFEHLEEVREEASLEATDTDADANEAGENVADENGSGSDGTDEDDTDISDIEYVEVDGYKQITQTTAQKLMETEEDYIILDVRSDEEYYEEHIPGAINYANEAIDDEKIPDLPDLDQMILVYCRSGRRSKDAARKLAKIGYTNVYEFGGIINWTGPKETEF